MLSKIKGMLPWWLKIVGKMFLSRAPAAYAFWQALGLFRHGRMDVPSYALHVFESHVARAGAQYADLAGRKILEIGPGDSIATAMIAYGYGASAILIDSGYWVRKDIEPYKDVAALLHSKGLRVPDLSSATCIDDILRACDGRYIPLGLEGWREIETGSVDFVFSQAVLEHIRRHEFVKTQKECLRVMAPGAVASHRVDLRDHLGGALNNLRFSERSWESEFFVKSGFYTNRIQMPQMIGMFQEAGFSVNVLNVERWPKLPTPRRKLAAPFSEISEQDLCVSGFDVLLSDRDRGVATTAASVEL